MDFKSGLASYRADLRERSKAIDAGPLVQRQCICPNQHKAVNGIVITSPACLEHGLRSPLVVHDGRFGFDVIWEEPAQPRPARHRVRLPINTEPRGTDALLTEAARQCRERLAAREATINREEPTQWQTQRA
jgi:hypothetical protein